LRPFQGAVGTRSTALSLAAVATRAPAPEHPETVEIPLSSVWRITTTMPYRPRSVHAYLVRGEGGWMLLDGGIDAEAAWRVVDRAVRVTRSYHASPPRSA
jgi:hypothetical protein